MFKKVLVPLDGSELAEAALPYAKELAKQFKGQLFLVYVVNADAAALAARDVATFGAEAYVEQAVEAEKETAREYLQKQAAKVREPGLSVSTEVREGTAADAITEAAHEDEVDVIVMATSGKTGIIRAVLGSVADEILRESGKPVLMLRPEDAKNE